MKKLLLFILCMPLFIAAENGKKHEGIEREINVSIGISTKDRKLSGDILNGLLAHEFVLLVKTLNYHWNLVGPEFHDYHLLFNDQYTMIFKVIDEVAERARAVGSIALGSMAEFIAHSKIQEDRGNVPAPRDMVENLLDDHEAVIQYVRKGITETGINNRDMGTNNFLAGLNEKHEKAAWMLRSLLERRGK